MKLFFQNLARVSVYAGIVAGATFFATWQFAAVDNAAIASGSSFFAYLAVNLGIQVPMDARRTPPGE